MIYKINHDFKNTLSFFVDPVELANKMPHYRPRQKAKSLSGDWVKPDASFYASENYAVDVENIPDVTTWKLGYLVLSKKAYDKLFEYLSHAGEFLSVNVGDIEYYIFNPLYVISDSAEDKTSAVEVIDAGVHLGQSNVSFDESTLEQNQILIFKTNTDQLVFSYCTEKFKQLCDSNDLKGIVFESLEIR